jgi:uncharacterized protein
VKVKELEVDLPRKRISLTMKLDASPAPRGERGDNNYRPPARGERMGGQRAPAQAQAPSAMAAAFAKLQGTKG